MDSARPTNRLAAETSAYLRQHMHNPVDWWPWGEEALARASAEGKPLLVSIGYSACHWCHVMERESFEDPETAAIMNEHFVSIKVDREERPDVDQIYMDTLMRLQGHGGWPLTVFCKPNGEPYYAGTYFPPESRHGLPSFQEILLGMARAWNEQRDQVDDNAARILKALDEQPSGASSGVASATLLVTAANQLLDNADKEHGGFGAAPKFPTPANLELLLAAEAFVPPGTVDEIRSFLQTSCEEMARRGLYDQLGGGFHRYCVDDHWGIPHFEKMLYDQGQLARIYADLWRRTGESDPNLVWPVLETAEWLRREMTGPEGGWFASQDADSEGEEGKFYVWRPAELDEVLGPKRGAAFAEAYSVSEVGNFEGKNALWDRPRGARNDFAAERAMLLDARSKRVPPGTDRKRVAAWNGFTISGLAYAGSVFEQPELVARAAECADFVLTQMRDGRGRLQRVFAEGEAGVPAFLDDMAGMLAACLDLFRAGAGDRFLGQAIGLAEDLVAHFYDAEEGDLFLSAEDGQRLPHRPRSDHDGATPNSTGLAVLGLLRTAELTGREDLRSPAEAVLRRHAFVLENAPTAYPTLLRAAAWGETGLAVAVVAGDPDADATRQMAHRARLILAPEEAVVVVAGQDEGLPGLDPSLLANRPARGDQATAYVCRGQVCTLPITDPAELEPPARSLTRESPDTNG